MLVNKHNSINSNDDVFFLFQINDKDAENRAACIMYTFIHRGLTAIYRSTNPNKYRGSTQSYPSLIISNITYADEGRYKCAATNEFGTGISKTVLFLNVTGTPPNVTISKRYYNGETGQNISLSVSIYSPQSALLSVDWLFHFTGGSRQINVSASDRYMGSSVLNPSLHIVNLTSDDIGNYTCKAVNWYLPLVNIEQQNYLGNFGESILIICSIAWPDSEMFSAVWVFYDARNDTQVHINASSKYELQLISKLSLLIKNLSFSDEGLYRCLASNSFGTGYSNWTSLLIQDIPVVVIGSESYNAKFGHSVTLECNVSTHTALTRIYWEQNSSGNVIILSSDLAGISGASIENPGLTINVATSSDSAWYTCVAENKFGIGKSKVSRLNVVGGTPIVTGHETVVITTYGMSVTLHVSIASSPGHFNIYWTKVMDIETTIIHDSTIGTSGGSLFNPSLTIHFPTVSDAGIYQCYATNAIGIGHSEHISLIVEGVGTNGVRGSTVDMPSLTIMFVTSTDSGYYTCIAENIIGVGTSRASNLKVIAGPPVVNIGSIFYTTIFGTPVTLDCFVTSEPPVIYVVWQKNVNGHLTTITHGAVGTQGISQTSPSLTILFPGKSDQGEYTCFAVNDLGQRGSLPTILKVSGDVPTVDVPLTSIIVDHGNDVSLSCTVYSIPQHTSVYWIKETERGKVVLNHGTTGTIGITVGNPTLYLKPAATTDSGLYTCLALNVIGTGVSRTITLTGKNL
ncbi:HMCN [Mytilus edulis]|uniref:HMCN n=1 Tax=Mytilus edulis TaxID=6550 RepID=A0A8S3S342_MYTED|nr:HMCN [Mytilus edulis]